MMHRVLAIVLAAAALMPLAAPPSSRAAEPVAAEGSTRSLYLGLIRQARVDGKARAALAYLDDFERQYPGDREAQVLRVNCLLDLGQLDGAQAAVARIPSSERSGEALAARGHVFAAQERWSEAATAYAAAQAASPSDAFIGNAHGYAQLRAGQGPQAIETLRRALDLTPDRSPGHAVVRNNLALALTAAGRTGEATALLARVRDTGERARLQGQIRTEAVRLALAGSGTAPVAP